jgi:hypothetical protein
MKKKPNNPTRDYALAVEARRSIAKLVDVGLDEFKDVLERLDRFIGLFHGD